MDAKRCEGFASLTSASGPNHVCSASNRLFQSNELGSSGSSS